MTLNVFIDMGVDCVERMEDSSFSSVINTINEIKNIYQDKTEIFIDSEIFDLEEGETDLTLSEIFGGKLALLGEIIHRFDSWQDKKITTQDEKYFKYSFDGQTENLENEKHVLTEIAKRAYNKHECLLLSCGFANNSNLYVIQDLYEKDTTHKKTAIWTQVDYINCINEDEIFSWINLKIKPREFKRDPLVEKKHKMYPELDVISSTTKYKEELSVIMREWTDKYNNMEDKARFESPLLCSKERANELLQKAIGNPKKTELLNFDVKTGLFIEFKNTEPHRDNNNYHGYHRVDTEKFLEEVQDNHGSTIKKLLEKRRLQ